MSSADLYRWVDALNFIMQKLDEDMGPVWKTQCLANYRHDDDYCHVGRVVFTVDPSDESIVVTSTKDNLTCTCQRNW